MGRRLEYRRYSDEFKITAVRLSLAEGVMSKDVAEALDIHALMLSRWRKEYRDGKISGSVKQTKVKQVAELKQLRELRAKHEALKEEHSLLKKAIQFSLEKRKKSSNS